MPKARGKRNGHAAVPASTLPINRPRDSETGQYLTPAPPHHYLRVLFPNSLTLKQRRWLAVFLATGQLREASKVAKISWFSHYQWLEESEEYRACFQRCKEIATDFAEDCLHARAFTGSPKPVIYKGEITDWYYEPSDTLALAYLKANRPHKYKDALLGLTANAPAAIQINLVGTPQDVETEEKNNGADAQTIDSPHLKS